MSERFNVADIFGENVFNDTVMKERLPKNVYKNLKLTMEGVQELGYRERCNSLHTLVPAFNRNYC